MPEHETYMREALIEAQKAYDMGEVPIGAVIVQGNEVIARGHNLRETTKDPTAHAEVVAMREAALVVGSWRLDNCRLYVTVEPCCMCAGACINARVERIVFGTADERFGACGSLLDVAGDTRFNHRCAVEGGILAQECRDIMRRFFAQRR